MHVTSHDVARAAGVSQPTVSRALRDDPRVSPATKAKVRAAADDLGYVPLSVGRSLSTRSTGQVAVVADLGNPLYPRLMEPVHDVLAEAGLRMVLLTERTDDDVLSRHLLDRSVDGVLLTTVEHGSTLPHELHRRGVPFVFLNRVMAGVAADHATADNLAGGAAVADLFLGLGHTAVAAVMGPPSTSTSRDRERGFRDRLAAAGVELAAGRLWRGGYRHPDGVEGFARVTGGDDPPTALFCVNDFVAVGALNAAIADGVSVPADLTVVGFDNMEIASWPAFELTTVNVPVAEMARSAARLLVSRITGEAPAEPRHETFPTELVLRETHGRPSR